MVLGNIDPGKLKTRVLTAAIIAPISFIMVYYGGWPLLLIMAAFFVLAQWEWFWLAKKLKHFFLVYPLGVIYLCFCFYCFHIIGEERSFAAVLLLLLVIVSDVGAYFSGKIIGGPKMAKKISPNKTWAGLGGAMLTPAIVLILAELLFLDYNLQKGVIAYLVFFVFGCLIGICGQMGDILISLMKRMANVKDTGTLLPGHGGVLDRIDSLLLATPAFIALEYVMGNV